jgi:hypothetical protein
VTITQASAAKLYSEGLPLPLLLGPANSLGAADVEDLLSIVPEPSR